MTDAVDIELPVNWWPERVPEHPYVLADADSLLAALVVHADSQGRFYGDPELVLGLFWKQNPPLGFVTQCIWELVDRGDVAMRYAQGSYSDHPRSTLVIEHRQRFARWRGRQAVPIAVRREVFARDGSVCAECGATEALSLDHIIPYSHGGPDTPDNLRVLCRSCNSRKGNRV